MAVITISRSFASGGERFGMALAKHLDYDYMDNELIRIVARRANVSEDYVKSQEDGRTRALMHFISRMVDKAFIKRILGNRAGYMDPEIYMEMLKEIVAGLAEKGNMVLVGRGSHCILQGHEGAYFIRVVAGHSDRVKNAKVLLGKSVRNVERAIREQDLREKRFLEHFYRIDWMDLSLFHLVVNLSKVSTEGAIDLVADLIKS